MKKLGVVFIFLSILIVTFAEYDMHNISVKVQ